MLSANFCTLEGDSKIPIKMNQQEYYVAFETGKFFNIRKISVFLIFISLYYLSKNDFGQIECGIWDSDEISNYK